MRIWDFSPKYLCRQHLLAEHRELHAIWNILIKNKKGYSHHPEVLRWKGKLKALYSRHQQLVLEMEKRGYRHHSPLEKKLAKGKATQDKLINTPEEQKQILAKKGCLCFNKNMKGGEKMIEKYQVYKCNICGNIVEVLYAGGGQLVCCGQLMELLQEKTQDLGMEKHVPVVEKTEKRIKVKVGSIPHPMEESHFIQWIEVITQNGSLRKFLKPGELPEAEFCLNEEEVMLVREYCNLHGLWKK